MSLIIKDNLMRFVMNNANAMDRAMNRMAVDIERLSKAQVPIKKGPLRASGHFERSGLMKYKVWFNKVYARFQEFGGDGRRTVRRYTTPGTKKGYLKDAGQEISKNATNYLRQEASTVRV
jgi:hypothetical protein